MNDAARGGRALRALVTLSLILAGLASLAWGIGWIGKPGTPSADNRIDHRPTAVALGAVLMIAAPVFSWIHRRNYDATVTEMARFAASIDALPPKARWIDLVIASILSLFLEVALIRWHGTEFRACAYFKNITLLACFLGLGLGFARARRPVITFPIVLPLLVVQVLTMDLLSLADADRAIRSPFEGDVLWGMGVVTNALQACVFYGFFTVLFISTIAIFAPIGQLTGRLMDIYRTLTSYTVNIVGSILGVVLFAAVSFAWAPPAIWFGISAAMAIWLARHSRRAVVVGGLGAVLMIAWLGFEPRANVQNTYSPYQRLEIKPELWTTTDGPAMHVGVHVSANKTYYLLGLNLADDFVKRNGDRLTWLPARADAYNLPYRLRPRPERVLIVGAGAGNDVAAGIRNGAGAIDAVEIDPAIHRTGLEFHPESPYQSPRVRAVIQDARAFMKRAPSASYDMVVFGLLDSHTLLSGMAAIRLDNFVYTLESLAEAKRLLKHGGRLCLSFAVGPESPFASRMFNMIGLVFGRPPRTFRLQGSDTLFTATMGDDPIPPASAFPGAPETTAALAKLAASSNLPPSEDDWPFPFLKRRTWGDFPMAYVYLVLLLGGISIVWVWAASEKGSRLDGHFFFLGAAFLLVETKAIAQLALLFGTTWMVTSIVIIAILTLILLANWLCSALRPRNPFIAYAGLFISLLTSYFLPLPYSSGQDWYKAAIMASIIQCLPLFFAGIIFATSIQRCTSLPSALASNLLGAILGGLFEYSSMIWGIRNMCLVGLALYAVSGLFRLRSTVRTGYGQTA